MKISIILQTNIFVLFLSLLLPCAAASNDKNPDPALAHQLGLTVPQLEKLRDRYPLTRDALLAASPMQIQTWLWDAEHPEFDKHAEAQKFQAMHLKDEHGNINPTGLARALRQHYNNGHHYGQHRHDDEEEEDDEGDLFPVPPDPSTNQPSSGDPVPFYAGIQNTNWTWLGPGNVGGRVRSIVIHPTLTSVMWCGGVDGGVWKTLNGGTSWFPLNDLMGNLAVACLVMDPSNTNILYAGTGEGTYNADAIRGAGIFKTFDGGSNWLQLASTANTSFQYVNRMSIDPTNSQVILAATRSGIFRTTNGGTNWTQRLTTETLFVAFNPTNSTQAIASGYNGHTYYSIDGGLSWLAATGVPAPSGFVVGRVELAYSLSNPLIVYASVDTNKGTVFLSTDGGHSYTFLSTGYNYLSSQGWYDHFVWADPVNTNIVIVGGTDVYRSTDGGVTFTDIGGYSGSIHPDQHILVSSPLFDGVTTRTVFVGNDGGVFRATDIYTASSSSGWANLNHNLGITQFYGAAGNSNTSVIVGGTQDNGTIRYTTGGGQQGWTSMFGGDGGKCAADLSNSSYYYGEYVYLQIHRSANGGASSSYIYSGITDAGGSANFIAPFILDPNNPNTMLAGGASLWRTLSVKASTPVWAAIKTSIGSSINAIAVAPGNSDIIYVGHNNGTVYFTANGTAATPTWNLRNSGLPARTCTSLAVAPSGRVYATFGGYNSGNVWQSSNNGVSWVNISANLPFAPMNSIVVAPADTNTLYVGSDVGIYGTSNNGGTWATGSDGPANVAVDQLFWMGNKLIAVSHGRGIWSTIPNLGPPVLLPAAIAITGGNGNGLIDPNECNFLNLTVTNGGGTSASAISATLSSPTPGVSFLQNSSAYGTIPSGGTAVNSTAFRIGTTADFVCGTPVIVNASLTYVGGSTSISYTLPSGGSYVMNVTNGAALLPGDTDIGNHGDNDVTSLSLPFPVLFYGRTFTNVNAVANGNLQFLSGNIAAGNVCLPATGFNYVICPFWSDLRTDLPGNGVFTTLTGTAPNRIFGIEWRATVSSTLSNVDFEVLFYESQSRLDIVYGALDDSGTTATVGLQSGTGSSFTNFECNTGGLIAGLQLTYQLACTDGGGTCPPPVITSFTADSLSGPVPLLVNFTNLTTGATNYNWQFGDGNSSTDINPANLYLNASKYSVTLIASGPGGTNVLTKTNYVSVTNIPPNITVQPVDTIVALGSNTSLSVTATGTSLGYQWRLGGAALANATNSILLRNSVTCARAGIYDVIVSNTAASVLSSPALLTVVAPPGIAGQPSDQTVAPGQTAQFTITATNECGVGMTYQWQFFGTNLLGSTAASLSIPNAQLANAGPYDVVVTNFAGVITSAVATLSLSSGPVVILWPNLAGTNLVFYFATDLGRTYSVQYEDSLDDTNWQTAQTIPGDGTTNTFVAPVSDAVQRFFRLSVQ